MKNFDLKILENADDELLENISEYCHETPADRVRRLTARKYSGADTAASYETGTAEKYHRPIWHRILSYASVLLLTMGICAGGVLIFGHTQNAPDDPLDELPENITEITLETAEPLTETVTEFITEEKQYIELELYEDIPVLQYDLDISDEENAELVAVQDLYNRKGVDRRYYMDRLLTSDAENLSDVTNKSYIRHMMLNSVDYFDEAAGKGWFEETQVEFKTNLLEQTASEEMYYNGELTEEHEYHPDMPPKKDDRGNIVCSYQPDTVIRYPVDNYRIYICGGENHSDFRTDWTNLPMASNALFPQDIALSRLADFDAWDIVGTEEMLGRTCAVIKGSYGENEFTVYTDIETGIMLKCEEICPDGTQRINCGLYCLDVIVRED